MADEASTAVLDPHVPEIPDRTFPGNVTRITDALQPGTRTLLTEIDIRNPDGALTPGIYCTIELPTGVRAYGNVIATATRPNFQFQGSPPAVEFPRAGNALIP